MLGGGTGAKLRPQHQDDATGDRRVGQVEGRPAVLVVMEVQEVNHRTMHDAVDDITDGAPDDEAEGRGQGALMLMVAQHCNQPAAHQDGQGGEKPALPASMVGQKTEGRARVVNQYQLEERGDRDHLAHAHGVQDHPFTELIEQCDDAGQR